MSYWVIVVDDDTANLRMAGHILSRHDFRVTVLKSGGALLGFISERGLPDLILLDILMPGMDGFATLERVRRWERENGLKKTPVIFLTADDDPASRERGFREGISDYITKPFDHETLISRINAVMAAQGRTDSMIDESAFDKLTGMPGKAAAEKEMSRLCRNRSGCLMVADLDAFKTVNEKYGTETGDKMLAEFADMIRSVVPVGSKCARIDGDKFEVFGTGINTEIELARLARILNTKLTAAAKRLLGDDMTIPVGVSVGGVLVPACGRDHAELIKLAEKALCGVKMNGKHGAKMYYPETANGEDRGIGSIERELADLSAVFGERSIPNSALLLDKQVFSGVYQYIMRYIVRNHRTACKILFTFTKGEDCSDERFDTLCEAFGEHIKKSLRKTDILMRNRKDQFFVLLADVREGAVDMVVANLLRSWRSQYGRTLEITYVTEFVGGSDQAARPEQQDQIVLVDKDVSVMKTAGRTLQDGGFGVTVMKTTDALFGHLKLYVPKLILISADAEPINCSASISRLKKMGGETAEVPVMILADESDMQTAKEGLRLGAFDIVNKPIDSDILLQRVRNTLKLAALVKSMSAEIEKKLRDSKDLFLNIVWSFAELIDSKDHYSCGHSKKVAEYAREIARRAGLDDNKQGKIYMAALLHDVGKLSLPDEIIGKPSCLSCEEFEVIKGHSSIGAKTLESFKDMPLLASGARWHHERYGGGGYPDGLKGDEIPEEARIIAVADAYAAMTSPRCYRTRLTQERVREELKKCSGTFFDPRFVNIMISMIDDDKEYSMKEE